MADAKMPGMDQGKDKDGINQRRLRGFVEAAVGRSRSLPLGTARRLLQANAEVIRRHLQALSRWAAEPPESPRPPHLLGLSAFDLSDAAEELEAEAARRCA